MRKEGNIQLPLISSRHVRWGTTRMWSSPETGPVPAMGLSSSFLVGISPHPLFWKCSPPTTKFSRTSGVLFYTTGFSFFYRSPSAASAGDASTPIGFDVSLETVPPFSGSALSGSCFEFGDLHLSFDYDFISLSVADWGQYNISGVFRDARDSMSNPLYILPNIPLFRLFIPSGGVIAWGFRSNYP